MKGVVLCEYSGVVSQAFRDAGVECWSCDLLPTEGDPAWHFQQDAVEVVYGMEWDFMIGHPVCTKLANSGAKHLYVGGKKENGPYWPRWEEMEEGAHFYRQLRDAPVKYKAIENPVMHGAGIRATKRGRTWFYHPHYFGDPFFKWTGFEIIGFPPLRRTHWLEVPKPGTEEHKKWSKVHRMGPSEDRGHERSRFEPGFAFAMAAQWSDFLFREYDL